MSNRFTVRETIDATPAEVFEYLTDQSRVRHWDPDVVVRRMCTSGTFGTGSVFRETRRVGKAERTAEVEVIRHEGPSQRSSLPYYHAARTSAGGTRSTVRYKVVPRGRNRTELLLETETEATGLWSRLLGSLTGGLAKAEHDRKQCLYRLKRAVEQQPRRRTRASSGLSA